MTTGHNGQLKSIVERIEDLESEIKNLQSDRNDIYAEAKGNGFDPKIIKALVRERKIPASERASREELLESYRNALGQLSETPLGRAALQRAAG